MGISEEFIKKVLLGINYDTNKTLSENKIDLFEQKEKTNLDFFKGLKYTKGMTFNQYVGDDAKPIKLNIPIEISQELLKKEKEEQEKRKKEEYKKTPRGYAASLGYTNWKYLQSLFGCPSVKENKEENIKCNLNIKKALEQGWKPGDDVPENLKSNFKNKNNSKDNNKSDEKNDIPDNETYGEKKPKDENIPGVIPPKFDGNFYDWFIKNFNYPQEAISNKISGTVFVKFTVNEDGSISDVNASSENLAEDIITKDAIELVKKMPNWIPSTKDDVNIKSFVTIPIEYILSE